jgi:hypothetical protein
MQKASKTFKNMFMPFWCDGSVRLLCGQNVNDSMWAIVGNEKLYEWLWPPPELVLLSLH